MSRSVLAACVALTGAATASHAAGLLVAHWKFNEAPGATTAADSGPGGFTGTLNGQAAFVAGGIQGNAISLTTAGAGSYVEMAPIPFNGTPYSLSAWVKTITSDHSVIVGRHISTITQGFFLAINAGSGYGILGKAYAYESTFPGGEPISTTTVRNNQWHHLVMTHVPNGLVAIFVDGKLEDTRAAPAHVVSPAPVIVGGVVNPAGGRISFYTGLADDVQYYDGALTGPQICAMFNNPGQPAPIACNGDVNIDRSVNFTDLNIVLSNFGLAGVCRQGDADGDATVSFADLNIVLSNFGSSC